MKLRWHRWYGEYGFYTCYATYRGIESFAVGDRASATFRAIARALHAAHPNLHPLNPLP